MGEEDIWAQMGLPMGFGKQTTKKKVDITTRIDKTKRSAGAVCMHHSSSQNETNTYLRIQTQNPPSRGDDGADDGHYKIAPALARSETSAEPDTRPNNSARPPTPRPIPSEIPGSAYETDSDDDDDDGDDAGDVDDDIFPITHEITLKDHNKVVSALALDPPGARIASGSHDYDCKLWDFGGMNASLKPFKSWEPAGSYHVHIFRIPVQRIMIHSLTDLIGPRFMSSSIRMQVTISW